MNRLREIVRDVRRSAPSELSVTDAEIAREVGDVCSELLADFSGCAHWREDSWRTELIARTTQRLAQRGTA